MKLLYYDDNYLQGKCWISQKGQDHMKKKNMHCCEKCQVYWTCETKWYRGERGEENICCPVCNFYNICLTECGKNKPKKKK